MRLFRNRTEAGHELARHLGFLKPEEPVVLGLANGGVPVAELIADAMDVPLDVLLIERLRAPKNPEHIVGAVDEHGRISMIQSTARWHHLTSQKMVGPAREAFRDLQRRRGRVRAVMPEVDVRDRTVIVVSQGVASGAKILGAIASVRDRGARKVVAAAPAGSGDAAWQLHEAADLVVVPHRPAKFKSVEDFYEEFTPVTDDLVLAIVERWMKARPQQQKGVKTIVMKPTNEKGQLLCCELDLPPGMTRGSGPYPTVIFAHGYESDGRSSRTVPISRRLAKRGIIGVRADFTGHGRSEGELTEATDARMYNDLKIILNNVRRLDEVDDTRMGLVGSGSGGMLALNLTAEDPTFRAAIARGPMAGKELDAAMHVTVPTMLIYAELDLDFAQMCDERAGSLPPTHRAFKVADATRLFNDAISLELMVGASVEWLVDHLTRLPETEDAPSEPAEEVERGA